MFNINERKKYIAWLVVITDIFIVFEMIHHEGRYSLLYTFLQMPICLFFYLLNNHEIVSGTLIKKLKISGLVLIVLVAIISFGYIVNIFNIQSIYENSYLNGGGGVLKNERFDFLKKVISAMPNYPLGGYDVASPEGSHNMWLEYGNTYGVFVLGFLLIYKVLTIVDILILTLNKEIEKVKYLLLSTFIYINIYYSLEPNGFAHREFLVFGLFLCGMIGYK